MATDGSATARDQVQHGATRAHLLDTTSPFRNIAGAALPAGYTRPRMTTGLRCWSYRLVCDRLNHTFRSPRCSGLRRERRQPRSRPMARSTTRGTDVTGSQPLLPSGDGNSHIVTARCRTTRRSATPRARSVTFEVTCARAVLRTGAEGECLRLGWEHAVTEPVTRNRSRHARRRRRRAAGALATTRSPVEALQQSPHDMEPCVLVAAPLPVSHSIVEALADRVSVVLTSDPQRAAGLAFIAPFHAIVTVDGFLPEVRAPRGVPVVALPADGGAVRARRDIAAALSRPECATRRASPRSCARWRRSRTASTWTWRACG
jgi:hypothetical protein